MLDQITPVIITYNESPNIGRTLDRLSWARDIVVVDSFSDDDTLAIISRFHQARVFERKFVSHADQWSYALKETGVTTEWVLAFDADYVLTPELLEELSVLQPSPQTQGYRASFVYCVEGRPLKGSAYPPVTVLYRRDVAAYMDDGHSQRVVVPGEVLSLKAPILHDDRKSLGHWLQAQNRYMRLEAQKLSQLEPGEVSLPDRLRRVRFVAPFVMLFYCLFVKGVLLDGRAGLYYAFQRTYAELLLSLYLLDDDLRDRRQHRRPQGLPTAPGTINHQESNNVHTGD